MMVGIIVIYLAVMVLAGFVIATVIFIPVTMIIMGEKNKILIPVVGIGFARIGYFLFTTVFHVFLPSGLLFQ
jgi:hypothetical protein